MMTDPASIAGYKLGTVVAMTGGATAASLLMAGPLWARLAAGVIGGALAFVATPILAPLAEELFAWVYRLAGVTRDHIPPGSVEGVTGFVVALTGIDCCRWVIERTKGALAALRLPFTRS